MSDPLNTSVQSSPLLEYSHGKRELMGIKKINEGHFDHTEPSKVQEYKYLLSKLYNYYRSQPVTISPCSSSEFMPELIESPELQQETCSLSSIIV